MIAVLSVSPGAWIMANWSLSSLPKSQSSLPQWSVRRVRNGRAGFGSMMYMPTRQVVRLLARNEGQRVCSYLAYYYHGIATV